MKILFFLITVALTLMEAKALASDSNVFTTKEVIIRSNVYYHIQTNKPINGILKEFYKGILCFEYDLIDGIKNGTGKEYYLTGELQSEAQYKDGNEHGVTRFYYTSGALESEAPHKNGELHGIVKRYYEDGTLQVQAQLQDGKALWGYKYDEGTGARTKMTIEDYDDYGYKY